VDEATDPSVLQPPFSSSDCNAIKQLMDQAQSYAQRAADMAVSSSKPTDWQTQVKKFINDFAAGYVANALNIVWAPH
jgi:hypothetical protein